MLYKNVPSKEKIANFSGMEIEKVGCLVGVISERIGNLGGRTF